MASTRREKELARLRAERQAARREADAAKRRRRNAVVAGTVAVAVVAVGVGAIALRNNGDEPADPSASPSTAAGTCSYQPSGEASRPVTPPPATPTATGPVTATMTTDRGVITWSLATDAAPCASGSIISLASQDFFDDTPCHRLTTEGIFVLQCGDPTGTGSGGPGYEFAEENLEGASYPRGTVAMAKTSAPGTTGSQFFLVYQDSELPPQYTPVGTITAGLDVLDAVAAGGAEPARPGQRQHRPEAPGHHRGPDDRAGLTARLASAGACRVSW